LIAVTQSPKMTMAKLWCVLNVAAQVISDTWNYDQHLLIVSRTPGVTLVQHYWASLLWIQTQRGLLSKAPIYYCTPVAQVTSWQFYNIGSAHYVVCHSQSLDRLLSMLSQISCVTLQSTWQPSHDW